MGSGPLPIGDLDSSRQDPAGTTTPRGSTTTKRIGRCEVDWADSVPVGGWDVAVGGHRCWVRNDGTWGLDDADWSQLCNEQRRRLPASSCNHGRRQAARPRTRRDPHLSRGFSGTPGEDSANSSSSTPNLLIRRSTSRVHGRPQGSAPAGTGGFRFHRCPDSSTAVHREWLPTWLHGLRPNLGVSRSCASLICAPPAPCGTGPGTASRPRTSGRSPRGGPGCDACAIRAISDGARNQKYFVVGRA